MTRRGVGPMLAKLQPEIPRGEGWSYEPKWDGFRTIVTVGDGGVELESRTDRPMGRYFPEIVELVAARGTGPLVADGEIVMVRPEGLSFDELQLRLHPAASRVRMLAAEIPATLILFDLLEEGGEDLRARPLAGAAHPVGVARRTDRRRAHPRAAGRAAAGPGSPSDAVDRGDRGRRALVCGRGRARAGRHRRQADRSALSARGARAGSR